MAFGVLVACKRHGEGWLVRRHFACVAISGSQNDPPVRFEPFFHGKEPIERLDSFDQGVLSNRDQLVPRAAAT